MVHFSVSCLNLNCFPHRGQTLMSLLSSFFSFFNLAFYESPYVFMINDFEKDSGGQRPWVSKALFIGLCLGGERTQICSQFLSLFSLKFYVSCTSCLYILEIKPLPVTPFADILSHSVGCLFGFLFYSFLCCAAWTTKRSNQSILKEISPEYSLEGLMLKLKLQYFGHLILRTDSLEKTLMAGKDWRWEERGTTEDEMVGWHHWLNGHEFE